MSRLAYIIPVHTLEADNTQELFTRCLESIHTANQGYEYDIYAVGDKETVKGLEGNFTPLVNDSGDLTIQGQINFAVSQLDHDWIAYIEFDDMVNDNYRKVFENHARESDMDVLLPLGLRQDYKTGMSTNFFNTQFWSPLYSDNDEELGNITLPALDMVKDTPIFLTSIYLCGAVARKEVWELGMKKNIIQSFFFEFLIRAIKNGKLVKIGNECTYLHSDGRPDSFSAKHFGGSMTEKAMAEWVEQAFAEHTKKAINNV